MKDVFNFLKDTGLLEVIIMLVLTVFVIPLIRQASAKQKNAKVKEAYDTLDKLAQNAVNYMATQYETAPEQKREQAATLISQQLQKHKINLDSDDIDAAIEKAYQYFAAQNTPAKAKQKAYDEGLQKAAEESAKVQPAEKNIVVDSEALAEANKSTKPVTESQPTVQIDMDKVVSAVLKRLDEKMGDSSASSNGQSSASTDKDAAEPASQAPVTATGSDQHA